MRCLACNTILNKYERDYCEECMDSIFISEQEPNVEEFIAMKEYIEYFHQLDDWDNIDYERS